MWTGKVVSEDSGTSFASCFAIGRQGSTKRDIVDIKIRINWDKRVRSNRFDRYEPYFCDSECLAIVCRSKLNSAGYLNPLNFPCGLTFVVVV